MNNKFHLSLLIFIMILLTSSISYAVQDTNFGLGKAILKLLFYTLLLIIVLVITIYGTKFIANNAKRFTNSKYMQTIDILSLGTNIKLAIVEINGKMYILAITNNSIKKIDEISKDDFDFNKKTDFEKQLDNYKGKYIHDNEYFNKFNIKLNKMLNRTNKITDKEDEDNEKKC